MVAYLQSTHLVCTAGWIIDETGGGYYAPASTAHFRFLEDILACVRRTLQSHETEDGKENDIAAFIPSYTLSPHARYPTQLGQGLEVLQYLVSTENKALSNVVIGGDSAGGNLVLGILSQLSHPHPSLRPHFPLPLHPRESGCLAGALLLSPWVSNNRTAWNSVRRNRLKDSVTLISTDLSERYFLPEGQDWDWYNEPLRARAEWWTDLKTQHVLFVSGEDEIMTDAHAAMGMVLQVRTSSFSRAMATLLGCSFGYQS